MGNQGQTNHARNVEKIRELNDHLRKQHDGGRVFITDGVGALSVPTVARILFAVRDFDDFTAANDPYGEHDFGCVVVDGHQIFFKIDYYAVDLESGSPDPSEDAVTCRVLTIMLSSEY